MKIPKIKPAFENTLLFSSLPYYLLPFVTALVFVFSDGVYSYQLLFIIYGVLPLLDELFQYDWRNPTEAERRKLEEQNPYFLLALYAEVLLDWLSFFRILHVFATFELTKYSVFKIAGILFAAGNINAASFAVAHEIFHKQGPINKIIGTLHMSKTLYMHFTLQHLYGHHKNVATPLDPASAPKSLTLYQFLPKTIFGSWWSAYRIQERRGKPFYLNGAIQSLTCSFLFPLLVYYFTNFTALLLYLAYAAISIFYLEAINYIEHYGLKRNKLPSGEYEKVNIRHSWNAPQRFTNYLLYKLQRHSDHHQNSLKPYQTLLSLDDSPHLPAGYTVMIIMSFFPSSWFKVMDPLVEEYERKQQGQVDKKASEKSLVLTQQFMLQMFVVSGAFAFADFFI